MVMMNRRSFLKCLSAIPFVPAAVKAAVLQPEEIDGLIITAYADYEPPEGAMSGSTIGHDGEVVHWACCPVIMQQDEWGHLYWEPEEDWYADSRA
jgi:hypothetical protein